MKLLQQLRNVFFLCVFASIPLSASGIEDATTYHKNSSLQSRIAHDFIDQIVWKETDSMLDIGCGDGKITSFLAEKVSMGSVLGIDISKTMIDFAMSHYNRENLDFEKLAAQDLSYENQFDHIVSFSTLHWVIDQQKALEAMYRALAPAGRISLQIYGKGCMNVSVLGNDLVHTKKWAPYFPFYTQQRIFFTEEEYTTLLTSVGYKDICVKGSWYEIPFASRQDLILFAKPLLNFISHLPPELQQDFIEELIDKIMSIAEITDEGVIKYKIFSIQATGAK